MAQKNLEWKVNERLMPLKNSVYLGAMTTEAIQRTIQEKPLVLGYFSTPDCNVCRSLLPKVKQLLERYPRFTFVYVDTGSHPLLAGQHMVFAVPTLILFAYGREWKRFSRFVNLPELEAALQHLEAQVPEEDTAQPFSRKNETNSR